MSRLAREKGQGAARPGLFKTLFATCIGSALEWFDITVYGYFARYLAHVFFPIADQNVSLLLTFGSFGVAFLIRPLGALVLGAYADKHGRKASLLISLNLMMLGAAIITFLPGYATLGVMAPLLILLARLIQGFSAGGEFGSSMAFLVEHYPERKAFITSWQFATHGASTLMASVFGLGLAQWLTPQQLAEWGWRIPFAFGLLIGPIGLWIRRNLRESNAWTVTPKPHHPVKQLLAAQKRRVALAIGLMVVSTAVNYMLDYVPTWATTSLGLPTASAYGATLIAGVILTFITPFGGLLAERMGRVRLMWVALVLMAVTLLPAFWLTSLKVTPLSLALLVGWMALVKSFYFSTLPSVMADLFPVSTRASGMSISYNIAVTLFGGFAPFIFTVLIGATGSPFAPGLYLMISVFISVTALWQTQKQFQ